MGGGDKCILGFSCGICTAVLSDADALFTSCGHFFCRKPGKRCTGLAIGSPAGKCEQCGQECDAGTLENKAARYDDRVKQFVLASLPDELKRICDIIEFRERHTNILRDNAAALVERNAKLKEEISTLVQENISVRSEIEKMRSAVGRAAKMDPPLPSDDDLHSEVTPVGQPGQSTSPSYIVQHKEHRRGSQRHLDGNPKDTNGTLVPHPRAIHKSRLPAIEIGRGMNREPTDVPNVPSGQRRVENSQRLTQVLHSSERKSNQLHDLQPIASPWEKIKVGRQQQDAGRPTHQGRLLKSSRRLTVLGDTDKPRKRNGSTLHAPELTTKRSKVAPGMQGRASSLFNKLTTGGRPAAAASYASKQGASFGVGVPGARGYKSKNYSDMTKFARTAGQRLQNRPTASSLQNSMWSKSTSWQARVSTLPRPSVTPGLLQRVRKKPRPRGRNNPVASRR